MKIATITTNYNSGKYIEDCLDGLLAQTLMPNNIVVVDDCSTDDSVNIIKKYLTSVCLDCSTNNSNDVVFSGYYNTTQIDFLVRQKNGGPAAGRNTAIDFIINKTDYIFVCDIDDVYYPNKIEESMKIFKEFRSVGLVYSDYDTLHEQTNSLSREYKEPYSHNKLLQECIVSNNSAIAVGALKMVGRYNEEFRGPEDYDMWLRLAEVCAVHHIPKALYKYRISGNNITITTPSENFAKQVMKVKQNAFARLQNK